jgi:tagaturonate reductase
MIALQYGDGNFLRGFVDWMIHEMNEAVPAFNCEIIVLKSRPGTGLLPEYTRRENKFKVHTKGFVYGDIHRSSLEIKSIKEAFSPYSDHTKYSRLAEIEDLKLIFSNTTEAGIFFDAQEKLTDAPPLGYIGKLTQLLFKRYSHFDGDPSKGVIIIPCELLKGNGDLQKSTVLKYIDLWRLPEGFTAWLHTTCTFCNTLVDRIITSPTDVENPLDVQAEPYHLFVIEDFEKLRDILSPKETKLEIIFTDNLEHYRKRKVRILNGGHTSMVPVGHLAGFETVQDCMESPLMSTFIERLTYNEICPSLNFPGDQAKNYADQVLDRFRNPFLNHKLLRISLNSISKLKVRIVTSIKAYEQLYGKLPQRLCFAFASMIIFYSGKFGKDLIPLSDTQAVKDYFSNLYEETPLIAENSKAITQQILANDDFWEEDLNAVGGLTECISNHIFTILTSGMTQSIAALENG